MVELHVAPFFPCVHASCMDPCGAYLHALCALCAFCALFALRALFGDLVFQHHDFNFAHDVHGDGHLHGVVLCVQLYDFAYVFNYRNYKL